MEQLQYLIDRLQSIDEKFDEKLDRILVQTTKTNGRVTSLEKNYEKTQIDVEALKIGNSETKGRDKAIYVVLVCAGTIAGIMIEHFLFKS